MNCPKCKAPAEPGNDFCGNCGAALPKPQQSASQKPLKGICSQCKSRNLKFFDDGTGECPDCGRVFVWKKDLKSPIPAPSPQPEPKPAPPPPQPQVVQPVQQPQPQPQVQPPTPTAAPAAAPTSAKIPICPTCNKQLKYVESYKRWYCLNCKKYPPSKVVQQQLQPSPPQQRVFTPPIPAPEAEVASAPELKPEAQYEKPEEKEEMEESTEETMKRLMALEEQRAQLVTDITLHKLTIEKAEERFEKGEIADATFEHIKEKREGKIKDLEQKLQKVNMDLGELEDIRIEMEVRKEIEERRKKKKIEFKMKKFKGE